MADCKPTDKSATEEVDLTSISSILNIILGIFSLMQTPVPPIPPALLMIGARLKSGLSGRNMFASNEVDIAEQTNLPTGNVFQDGPNNDAKARLLQAKGQVHHFKAYGTSKGVLDVAAVGAALAQGTPAIEIPGVIV